MEQCSSGGVVDRGMVRVLQISHSQFGLAVSPIAGRRFTSPVTTGWPSRSCTRGTGGG